MAIVAGLQESPELTVNWEVKVAKGAGVMK